MTDKSDKGRIPPPAFPPGLRRRAHQNSQQGQNSDSPAAEGSDVDAGLISPDDPMPERRDSVESAFISPDDPIPERKIKLLEEFQTSSTRLDPEEEGEGVATGIGLDEHLTPTELVTGGDPHVMELVEAVGQLAEAIKRKGEAGLRRTLGMSPF